MILQVTRDRHFCDVPSSRFHIFGKLMKPGIRTHWSLADFALEMTCVKLCMDLDPDLWQNTKLMRQVCFGLSMHRFTLKDQGPISRYLTATKTEVQLDPFCNRSFLLSVSPVQIIRGIASSMSGRPRLIALARKNLVRRVRNKDYA